MNKIRFKLALLFCILFAAVFVPLYIYLNSNLKAYVESRIEDNLRRELLLTKDLLDNEASRYLAFPAADAFADRVAARLGCRITIIAPDGSVMGDSRLDESGIRTVENHLERPEVQGALNTGFGMSRRFSSTIRTQMLYMAVPLGAKGARGVLRMAMSLSDILVGESRIRRIIGYALLFALTLAVALTFTVSTFVSEPLSEMSVIAERIAGGDFSRKVCIRSRDEIGRLASAINHMSDEIEKEIAKVRSEEAKLRAMITHMFEGLLLTDDKGAVLLMNPSLRKTLLVEVAPEGKMPLEVIRNAAVHEIVEDVLKGDRGLITAEMSVHAPAQRTFKVNGVPMIREGRVAGALLVFHDITELKRLEAMRRDFVANVSHELRTPVASIKGYAETLVHGAIDDKEDAREFVDIIYRDSERLAKLVEDLLDLSRIESGRMKMVFLPAAISDIVKKALAVLDNQAKAKSIRMAYDITEGLPKVVGDEARLIQVMVNLLDNAIRYTPMGGSVTIRAYPQEGFVRVDVSDTGIGIPNEDLPRIFERFYTVDRSRSKELGGTGLGLSIVKHIVQAHRGEVWAESEPGKGSTFSFTIPQA
ncbi:MAG: HAMP domain-containing protein [Candidatus Omnitrophica bacterium]|nr:HAMP domain-containing protein [Candidatus Omnitrophota bacterium]